MGGWKAFQEKYGISGELAEHPLAAQIRSKLDRQATRLRDSLKANGELDAYVICMVDEALDEIARLTKAGYSDGEATISALAEIVPDQTPAPDETDEEDVDWELEGGMADEVAALETFLENKADESPKRYEFRMSPDQLREAEDGHRQWMSMEGLEAVPSDDENQRTETEYQSDQK